MENDLEKESEIDFGRNTKDEDFGIIFKGKHNSSITETEYLLSSKRNREKLAESIKQMKKGNLSSCNFDKI